LITRRLGLLGGLFSTALVRTAHAERLVTMLIGAAQGSSPDKVARDFGVCFDGHLDTIAIAMRNLPGGSGWAMLTALGDAPPDGGTIGWVSTPSLPARLIDQNDPSLLQRIRLLGQVEREPVAFVSPASDPVDSVQDIIQRAGNDADAVPLGTPPAGSPPHLAALRLQVLAQTRLNIVTFPSAAATVQAVLAGNVSAAALGLSDVIEGLRDGKLSALGIAARRRFGVLPDTPVLNEAGIPLAAFIRRGIAVPAATPAALTDLLTEALRAVTADEAFRTQAETNGYQVAWTDGPAWLVQLQEEQAALAKLWETDPWMSSSGG
jgi:tripartite-type tricarboxylate transporter receptor subunit TctC